MARLVTFLLVIFALYISASYSGEYLGVQSSCINSRCVVGAHSSILSIIISIALVLFLVLRPNQKVKIQDDRVVGVWRRLGAFYLDFALVLLIVVPITAIPMLVAEGQHTGTFEWFFVRKFTRPSDAFFALPAVLACFAALYFYFFYTPFKDRQTLGEYVLGFKIVPANEVGYPPNFGWRPFLGFIGLCTLPISVYYALKKDDKRFWWDTESRTRAVMVSTLTTNE